MPKTLSPDDGSSNKNPYIKKGISSNLLTPCRQMGLSRKKTPNSFAKTTPSLLSVSGEDSPVITLSADKKVDIKNKRNTLKKAVSKCLDLGSSTSSTSTEINDEVLTEKSSNLNKTRDVKVESGKKVQKTKLARSKVVKKKLIIDSDQDDEPLSVLKGSGKKDKVEVLSEESDEEELIVPTWSKKKTKVGKEDKNQGKVRKNRLQIESDDEYEETKDDKAVQQEDHTYYRMYPTFNSYDEIEPLTGFKSFNSEEKIATKLNKLAEKTGQLKNWRRTLSMKKTFSEGDDKSPSNNKKIKLITDCMVQLEPEINLLALEKEVADKEKVLRELKQAQIYQKQHNIEKLTELTGQWKTGCIMALNDLLTHSQSHVDTDMKTLLSKLNVPEGLLQLSPTGELI